MVVKENEKVIYCSHVARNANNANRMHLQIPENLSSETLARLTIQIIKLKENYCSNEWSKKTLQNALRILLSCDDAQIGEFRDDYTQTESVLEQNRDLQVKEDENHEINSQETTHSISGHPSNLSDILYDDKHLKKSRAKVYIKRSFYRKTRKCFSCGFSYKRQPWTALQNRVRRNCKENRTCFCNDQKRNLKIYAEKMTHESEEKAFSKDQDTLGSLCNNILNDTSSKQPVSSLITQSKQPSFSLNTESNEREMALSSKESITACSDFGQWDEIGNKRAVKGAYLESKHQSNLAIEVNQDKCPQKSCMVIAFKAEPKDEMHGRPLLKNGSECRKYVETKAIEDSLTLQTKKDDCFSSEEETIPLKSLQSHLKSQKATSKLISVNEKAVPIEAKDYLRKEDGKLGKLSKINQHDNNTEQSLGFTENSVESIPIEIRKACFPTKNAEVAQLKPTESVEKGDAVKKIYKEAQNIEKQQENTKSDFPFSEKRSEKNHMLSSKSLKTFSVVVKKHQDVIPESVRDLSKSRRNHHHDSGSRSPCETETYNYSKEKKAMLEVCFRQNETPLDTKRLVPLSKIKTSETTAKVRKRRAYFMFEDPERIKRLRQRSHVNSQDGSSDYVKTKSEDNYEKVKKCAIEKFKSAEVCAASESKRKREHEDSPKRHRGRPRKSSLNLGKVDKEQMLHIQSVAQDNSSCLVCKKGSCDKNKISCVKILEHVNPKNLHKSRSALSKLNETPVYVRRRKARVQKRKEQNLAKRKEQISTRIIKNERHSSIHGDAGKRDVSVFSVEKDREAHASRTNVKSLANGTCEAKARSVQSKVVVSKDQTAVTVSKQTQPALNRELSVCQRGTVKVPNRNRKQIMIDNVSLFKRCDANAKADSSKPLAVTKDLDSVQISCNQEAVLESVSKETNVPDAERNTKENVTESADWLCSHQLFEIQKCTGENNSSVSKASSDTDTISLDKIFVDNKSQNCDVRKEVRYNQPKNTSILEEIDICMAEELDKVSSNILDKHNVLTPNDNKARIYLSVKPKVFENNVISTSEKVSSTEPANSTSQISEQMLCTTVKEKQSREVEVQTKVASQTEKQNVNHCVSGHISSICCPSSVVPISKTDRQKIFAAKQNMTDALSKSQKQVEEPLTLIDKCNSRSYPLFTLTNKNEQGTVGDLKNSKEDNLQIQVSNMMEKLREIKTDTWFAAHHQETGEPTYCAQYNQLQPVPANSNAIPCAAAGSQLIHHPSLPPNFNAFPCCDTDIHKRPQNRLHPRNNSFPASSANVTSVGASEHFRDPRVRKYLPLNQQELEQNLPKTNELIVNEQAKFFNVFTDTVKQPHGVASNSEAESLHEITVNKRDLRHDENSEIKCSNSQNKLGRGNDEEKKGYFPKPSHTSSHLSRHETRKGKHIKVRVIEKKWKMFKMSMQAEKPYGKTSFLRKLGLFGFHGRRLVRGRYSFPYDIPISPIKGKKSFYDPRLNIEEASINTALLDILTVCIDGKEKLENIASHLEKLEKLWPNLSSDKLVDFISMNSNDLFLMYSLNRAALLTALKNHITKPEGLNCDKNISEGPEENITNEANMPLELSSSALNGGEGKSSVSDSNLSNFINTKAKPLAHESGKSDIQEDRHQKYNMHCILQSMEKFHDIRKWLEQSNFANGDTISHVTETTKIETSNSGTVGEVEDVTLTVGQDGPVLEQKEKSSSNITDSEVLKQLFLKIPDLLKLVNLCSSDGPQNVNTNESSTVIAPNEDTSTTNQDSVAEPNDSADTRNQKSDKLQSLQEKATTVVEKKQSTPPQCSSLPVKSVSEENNPLVSSKSVVEKSIDEKLESLQSVHTTDLAKNEIEQTAPENSTMSVNALKESECSKNELVNTSGENMDFSDEMSSMEVVLDEASDNNDQTVVISTENSQLPIRNSLMNVPAPAIYSTSVSHYHIQNVVYPQIPNYSYYPQNHGAFFPSQLQPLPHPPQINNSLPTQYASDNLPFHPNMDFYTPSPLQLSPFHENYGMQNPAISPEMYESNPPFYTEKFLPQCPPIPVEKYPSPPPLPVEYPSFPPVEYPSLPPTDYLPPPPSPTPAPSPIPPVVDVIPLPATIPSIPLVAETTSVTEQSVDHDAEKSKNSPVFIKPTLNRKCSHKCKHGKSKKFRRHRNRRYPILDTPTSPPAEYTPPRPSTPTHVQNAATSALSSKVDEDLVSLLFLNLMPGDASEKNQIKKLHDLLESNPSATPDELLQKLKQISFTNPSNADNTTSSNVPYVSDSVPDSATVTDMLIPEKLNDTFLFIAQEKWQHQDDNSKQSHDSPVIEMKRQNHIHSPVYTTDLVTKSSETEVDNAIFIPTNKRDN